jgi:hypothetical protein
MAGWLRFKTDSRTEPVTCGAGSRLRYSAVLYLPDHITSSPLQSHYPALFVSLPSDRFCSRDITPAIERLYESTIGGLVSPE